MPKVVRRNIFDDELDLYVVTTNGYITKDDKLVMGRGAALMAKKLCPLLPEIASRLTQYVFDSSRGCRVYGFVESNPVKCIDKKVRRFGLFQVKYHWRDKADLALIGFSILSMNKRLDMFEPKVRIGMNYPGIGNGGLSKEQVAPLLESLDKRVMVYEL